MRNLCSAKVKSSVARFSSYTSGQTNKQTNRQADTLAPLPGVKQQEQGTRSHPEMVGDMSPVTLNFDLSKIPFVHF